MMATEPSPIQRIARGAVQTFGSAYAARLINFVVLYLLYYFLVPEDFGAVGTAYSLLVLAVSLRDFGLHYALLHEHDNVHKLAPTHFVLSVSLGAISTLLALLIALFYDQAIALVRVLETYLGSSQTQTYPKVAIALAVFGLFDFVRTAALTAEVQLQRDLAFGRLAFAHAGGTVLAAFVGLSLAYFGFGKWALILGFFPYSVTYVITFCTVVWAKHPPPLRKLTTFDKSAARRMVRYGWQFWLGGVPKIFVQHYDKLLISLFFGLSLRGIYDAAHNFAQMPTGAITLAIVRITGAVYARYQKDRAQLSAAFRRALRLVLRATVPISLVLALEANRWILLFKPDWIAAAPLLQWLIIYSLCRPMLDDLHALFYSVGAPMSIAKFASVQALLLLILAPTLAHEMGVYGIAVSMNIMAIVGLVLALYQARRFVDVPIVKTFGPPIIAAVAGIGIRLPAESWLATLPTVWGFLIGAAIFCLGYAIGLLVVERKTILGEMQTIIQAIRPTPSRSTEGH